MLEICSCAVPCPCSIGEDPDDNECFGVIAFSLERRLDAALDAHVGERGVKLSGGFIGVDVEDDAERIEPVSGRSAG